MQCVNFPHLFSVGGFLNRLVVFSFLFLSHLLLGAIQVEQVEAWAQNNPKSNFEDFLNWVKQTDPEQLSWFTLMKQSQSAQGASSINPRAIVFGAEAKFIFTFNGDPKQDGYNDIEMLFFREGKEAKWELRKLSFDTSKKNVSFSEPNPNSCLSCHQNPVRPIWSQYDIWKGAYGENDDAILDFENDKYAGGSLADDQKNSRKKELTSFKKFLKNKETHSRYSKLQFPEGSPVSPYSTENRSSNYRFRPNLKLTEALLPLHSKVLVSRLKTHPEYEKEKKLLTALLLRCEDYLEDYSSSIKAIFNDLDSQFKTYNKSKVPWNQVGYTGAGSRRHYLLYLLGLEYSDFSLEKEATKWSYFGGELYSEENLAIELYTQLSDSEPSLPALSYADTYNHDLVIPKGSIREQKSIQEVCRHLLESRVSSGKVEASGPKPIENPLVTCLGCHYQGGPAPYVPFDNKERILNDKVLKDIILSKITSEDQDYRMPPTRHLSEKEIEGIRLWLSQ